MERFCKRGFSGRRCGRRGDWTMREQCADIFVRRHNMRGPSHRDWVLEDVIAQISQSRYHRISRVRQSCVKASYHSRHCLRCQDSWSNLTASKYTGEIALAFKLRSTLDCLRPPNYRHLTKVLSHDSLSQHHDTISSKTAAKYFTSSVVVSKPGYSTRC